MTGPGGRAYLHRLLLLAVEVAHAPAHVRVPPRHHDAPPATVGRSGVRSEFSLRDGLLADTLSVNSLLTSVDRAVLQSLCERLYGGALGDPDTLSPKDGSRPPMAAAPPTREDATARATETRVWEALTL